MYDYDDFGEYKEYEDFEENIDEPLFDYDDELSVAENFSRFSADWRKEMLELDQVFQETFSAFKEYEEAFEDDFADDPEFMKDRIAFNGYKIFAGMFGNAAATIGNFLDAASGFLNGDGLTIQVHNETSTDLEKTYKIGDHLKISRGIYTHHGIYAGDGTVIHYSQGYDDIPEIREVPFSEFAGVSKVIIVPKSESPLRFSVDEAVRRARSRLGEKNYNLIYNNCENFVRWCRAGG